MAGFAVAILIEPASTLISYLAEWAKSTISVKVAQNNAKIEELNHPQKEMQKRAIGFTIPGEEGDYEDEE